MADLSIRLHELGLEHYLDAFVTEGFDSWTTLAEITESDLTDLNVKLGHRRKLQRAIADDRALHGPSSSSASPANAGGQDGDAASSSTPTAANDSARSLKSVEEPEGGAAAPGAVRTKRKYKRHPKPDPHAPERAASAYVIFSNHMRDVHKGQDLSFTDMAKLVGEKWQVLPPETRDQFERQANAAKEKFNAEMTEYRKTEHWRQYQEYLADFKRRTAPHTAGDKRARLETETSTETTSSRDSDSASLPRRRSVASLQSMPSTATDGTSPHTVYSSVTSPANGSFSSIPPPAGREFYGMSPGQQLPPMSLPRQTPYELPWHPAAAAAPVPLPRQASASKSSFSPSSTSPSSVYQTNGLTVPVTVRESPTLSHTPTQAAAANLTAIMQPNAAMASRTLPAPIPTVAYTSPYKTSVESPRQSSSLAALLRAGELAREADESQTFTSPQSLQ